MKETYLHHNSLTFYKGLFDHKKDTTLFYECRGSFQILSHMIPGHHYWKSPPDQKHP